MMVKNEEKNLSELLPNLRGVVDEIVAIDHESNDRTAEILLGAGARVIRKKNPTEKNWADVERALLNENARYEWILHIDADERLTEEARAELPKLAKQSDYDVIWLLSKHFYAPGKWFGHGFYRPHHEPRFYRKNCKINWNMKIHEAPRIEGKHFYSNIAYDHLYYTAGAERIRQKHDIYVKVEREQKGEYLSRNPLVKWAFILLGYPVYFLHGLITYGAFLDGWAGIATNHFLASYFARAGYLEVAFKKKLGLIRYDPFLKREGS